MFTISVRGGGEADVVINSHGRQEIQLFLWHDMRVVNCFVNILNPEARSVVESFCELAKEEK